MAELLGQMNTRIIKEPLGFIRVIEFPMVILAFATTAGYSASMLVRYPCTFNTTDPPLDKSDRLGWSYPFELTDVFIRSNFCDPTSPKKYIFGEGAVSQSQFFVCTGILSFLYILAILCVYLFQLEKYETDNRWPALVSIQSIFKCVPTKYCCRGCCSPNAFFFFSSAKDFLITAILALFWFIASCAWAAGVNSLKSITEPVNVGARIIENSVICLLKDHICKFEHDYNFASLNVSLIAGFTCFFLFASNLWFIWKETEWFKSRHPPASTTAPSSGPPQSAASYSGPR
ncbi:hypothetical protein D918_04583 [Trichuris suis]|nr:hypothetical protein D918_04583 [Trichuris suis]